MYLSEAAGSTALGRDVHLESPLIHLVTINKLLLCAQHCSREGNQGKEASKGKIPTLMNFTFLWEEMDFPGEGIGYPLQYSWASLVAETVKNPPAMWETWV